MDTWRHSAGPDVDGHSAGTAATDVVGSAQSQVVRFRADRAEYEIVFTFGRPWETVAAETQIVTVRVRERHREESR